MNNSLCMDYNPATMDISVSLCYPSYDPVKNRDPTQQWVWGEDAMVRPYADQSLCLDTTYLEGNTTEFSFFSFFSLFR